MSDTLQRRAAPRAWLTVLILASLTMVGPFTIDTIFPAFPAIERDFAVDAVAMQQSISVYLLTLGVMSLLHGPVSDAVGRKPVIIAGMLLYAVASVVCALAPSLPVLLLGRALQGLCAGAGTIVGRTVVRDLFHGEHAQRVMAQISMIFAVAPAAAPIFGGWLLGIAHWRMIFWSLTIMAVLLALSTAVALPETHPAGVRSPLRLGALGTAVLESARDRSVQRLVAVASFNFAALFTYISAAPAIVVTHLGLGAQDFGWLFVPIVIAMMTGSWLTGRLAGTLTSDRFLAIGFGLSTMGALVGLLVEVSPLPRFPWILVGPMLTGLGIALVFPIATLLLLDLSSTRRGTLSTLQAFASTLLNAVLAGVIVPIVATRLETLSLTALGFSALGWLTWRQHVRRRGAPPAQRPLGTDDRPSLPRGREDDGGASVDVGGGADP